MLTTNITSTLPLRSRKFPAALLMLASFALVWQIGGQAQAPDAELQFSRGYLITGNYVVGGVDLPRGGGNGTINFNPDLGNTVPAGAEVIAAWAIWETIEPVENAQFSNALFRDQPIGVAKATRLASLPGTGASCWGSSGGSNAFLTIYRADVLHLLPKQYDANDRWTGRYLVNDADLAASNQPLHTITLPPVGTGNRTTTSAGATLMLVWRHPDAPLRKIVLYDGAAVQAQGAITSHTIGGFYKASASPSAQITYVTGSGADNTNERVLFNGTVLETNPFPKPVDAGSDRGWSHRTFDVSALMGLSRVSDDFGQLVTTRVDHGETAQSSTPYECPSFAEIIFSVTVEDADRDGIPDALEAGESSNGVLQAPALRDPPTPAYPNGQLLPELASMGARVGRKDLIVEINRTWARGRDNGNPGTIYGSPSAPYSATRQWIEDEHGHDHMPNHAVLTRVGDAYASGGIAVHFDVGSLEEYRSLGPEYACPVGDVDCDRYFVPSEYARGGERIEERACADCQFKHFPGTVGWPYGLQLYRNAPVGPNGEELTSLAQIQASDLESPQQPHTLRRRFDRNRQPYIHYALFAHARGKTRPPCLDERSSPADYNHRDPVTQEGACTAPFTANPQFPNVPTSASGVADLPGGNVLVTLGLWDSDKFVGSEHTQASTFMHELGHNLFLWHGGAPAVFGDKAHNISTQVEPNCKPNYLSVMSYLFQVHGLFDFAGNVHLDYSRSQEAELNEFNLTGYTFASSLRPAWFAPADSDLAASTNASAARRYCHGAGFGDIGTPPVPMARVDAPNAGGPIDWDGDGQQTLASLDVNFDRIEGSVFVGHDDWANARLDQIGAGRIARIVKGADGDLLDFGSGDLLDFGSGDLLDFGSGDLLDFGSGTHMVHLASGDFFQYGSGDLLDFGSGDLLDFGSGDLLDFGSGVLKFAGESQDPDNAAGDLLDFGSGDLLDFGSGDLLDFGSGDLLDFGSGDLLDFGSGDLLDFGSGDLLDFGSGTGLQELDFDFALALARPRVHGLTVCVLGEDCPEPQPQQYEPTYHRVRLDWNAPIFGVATGYEIYRRHEGSPIDVLVGTTSQTTFVDAEELPDGIDFAYSVVAVLDDGAPTPKSDPVTKSAVNRPPVAVNDSYTADPDVALQISVADGVLQNDRVLLSDNTIVADVDSPAASLRVRRVVKAPDSGTLAAGADGSFTYTPNAGFHGVDTFAYEADNGAWSGDASIALSGSSNAATVTITVGLPSLGFRNVQNLPPPGGKKFNTGSTVPLLWQWTNSAGVALNTGNLPVVVQAFACSTSTVPGGSSTGVFTPQAPGSGNSFAFNSTTNTWQFNWKLVYAVNGVVRNLPAGTYIIQVKTSATGQPYPVTNTCATTGVKGALITVK